MAQDQERGARLRDLKDTHGVRWKELAAHAGVQERSVLNWAAGKGMDYAHAEKVAEFFRGRGADVDTAYIWNGAVSDTPSPFAPTDALLDRMAALEDDMKRLLHDRESLRAEIARQNGLLARQSLILERIESLVAVLEGAQVIEPAAESALPEPEGLPPLGRDPQAGQPTEPSTDDPGDPGPDVRRRAS
jgi:hypothetical protein